MMQTIIPENNPVQKVESDLLDNSFLSIDSQKAKIILGGLDLSDMITFLGAEGAVKESTNQTIVSFPVTRRNGSVLQVTGTDDKMYSFDGMLIGDKSKNQKTVLEALFRSGIPMKLFLYYDKELKTVIPKSWKFSIETGCRIRYSVELIEYKPEVLVYIEANIISANQDWSGSSDSEINPDNPNGSVCEDITIDCVEPIIEIKFSELLSQGSSSGVVKQEVDKMEHAIMLLSCCKDMGVSDDKCQKTKQFLTSLVNGMYDKLLFYLINNSYVADSESGGYKKIDFSGCMDSKFPPGSSEKTILMDKIFRQIYKESCFLECQIVNVKMPLFEDAPNGGKRCISKRLFEMIGDPNSTYGMIFAQSAVIRMKTPRIIWSKDCWNYCQGKAPNSPITPEPTLPTPPGSVTGMINIRDTGFGYRVDTHTACNKFTFVIKSGYTGKYRVSISDNYAGVPYSVSSVFEVHAGETMSMAITLGDTADKYNGIHKLKLIISSVDEATGFLVNETIEVKVNC